MSELSRITPKDLQLQDESAPPSSALSLLMSGSEAPLSEGSLRTLEGLMRLAKARYPNQEMPPATADMYAVEWEAMVVTFGRRDGRRDEAVGLELFADALRRTLSDRDRPQFFPAPEEIETRIREKLRATNERAKTLAEIAALDAAKEQWERERAEDRAAAESAQHNPAA